jgi:YidC/Oxa1 family membrane protein insertase
MEKRVFIAVLLSIAVMYGYSYLVPAPPKSPAVRQQQPVQQQVSAVQPLSGKPSLPVAQTVSAPAVAAQDVVVETDLYTAVLSTSGAAMKKLVLKKYKTTTGPGAKEIALIAENSPENFSLRTIGNGLPVDPSAAYSVNAGFLRLAKGEKKSLEFTFASPQGCYIKKIFTFSGDGYAIGLEQQVGNTSGAQLDGVLQLIEKNRAEATPGDSRFEIHGPVTHVDNAVKEEKIGDLAKGAINFDKNVLWSGFADKYFLGAVIAEKGSIASVQIRQSNGYVENVISSPRISLAPGASAAVSYRLYFGPKDLEILKAQGSKLEEVIDFGWFSMLAKPLILSLKFLYKYTHNYGIAIIIITVILKLLFFPLTHKSYKSMKEMQKLQPKMTALKEKYKNDRDAMNKAVMELYKTHKVNPMGGCLPMVVQIPVFFALYKALMFSIELRHAPFMLWIKDLSGPDALISQLLGLPFTLGPLPLVMGVTMFIQQKMTPTNMDPMQAKIMLALPVVFTFMFLNFPSGLVLYWLVNNILTIAQQSYINKTLKDA